MAALARVRKMFEEEVPEDSHTEMGAIGTLTENIEVPGRDNKRRRLDTASATVPNPASGLPSSPSPPSSASLDDLNMVGQPCADPYVLSYSSPSAQTSFFTTGGGADIAAPSLHAVKAAANLFGDIDTNTSNAGSIGQVPQAERFQLVSGHSVPSYSASKIARAMALFDEVSEGKDVSNAVAGPSRTQFSPDERGAARNSVDLATSTGSQAFPHISSTCPQGARSFVRPHPIANSSSSRPTRDRMILPDRPSTPSRTPLRSTTNTFTELEVTETPYRGKIPVSIEIKTPAPARRIGLGSTQTPGSAPGQRRKGFVTPFKKEVGILSETTRVKVRTSAPGPSRSLPQAAQNQPVFDLSRESPHCYQHPDPMT